MTGHANKQHFLHSQGVLLIAEAAGHDANSVARGSCKGHADCVRFIPASGFSVDTTEHGGPPALHAAAGHGDQAINKQLLDSGADIEGKR